MNLTPHFLAIRRKFFMLALIGGSLLAFANSFGLQFLYAYFVDGNTKLASIASIFSLLITFLHIAILFFGYALVIYSTLLLGERPSRLILYANLVQIGVSSFSSLCVSYFSMTPRLFLYNLGSLLLYLFLNLLVYLFLLAVIRLAAVLLRKHLEKKQTCDLTLSGEYFSRKKPVLVLCGITTLIYIASALVLSLAETVYDLYLYGLPVNTEEWIYVVSPYVEIAAYFFIGYTVLVAVCYLLQSLSVPSREAE